jgi:hypothetical protein
MLYIDHQKSYRKKRSGKKFSHLISLESKEELHQFAQSISLGRHFFHSTPYPHYDVSEKYFQQALNNGAFLETTRELIQKVRKNGTHEI